MRKLVVDLMQPTIIKLNEDRENVGSLKALMNYYKKRVDYLEMIVLKKNEKNTHFDCIYSRLSEIVRKKLNNRKEIEKFGKQKLRGRIMQLNPRLKQ